MYNYIQGTITLVKANYIVLDNNGVGFLIKTPNPFNFQVNTQMRIYTYLHVREDIFELYGFKTESERDLFLKIISVKGIGPKGALAILATDNIERVISAITEGDSKYLQRFPGIGPKASQQIILDLRGKLDLQSLNHIEDPKANTIKEALKVMGFSSTEIKKVNNLIMENLDKDNSELLKLALKNLI